MRTGVIEIKGEKHVICFSTRVLIRCEERAGSFEKELQKIVDNDIKEAFWLLSEMIAAGAKYAEMEGMENAAPIAYEDLIDVIGLDDYKTIFKAITNTIQDGSKRKVEAQPEKNTKTTQAN